MGDGGHFGVGRRLVINQVIEDEEVVRELEEEEVVRFCFRGSFT